MTRITIVVLLAGLTGTIQGPVEPSSVTRDIKLGSGDKVFSSLTLTNTHARTYTDNGRPPAPPPAPSVPNQCSLDAKTSGVIWKIVLRGAVASAKDITVVDDTGRAFVQVCWSSSGGVYQLDAHGNRIGGGPQVEFLAAGSENPKQLLFKFGDTSAVISVSK